MSSATVDGTIYTRNHVLCCGGDDDEPLFGEIQQCLVTANEETFFIMRELNTGMSTIIPMKCVKQIIQLFSIKHYRLSSIISLSTQRKKHLFCLS